jgi:uncharacterized protein (TIGR03083 family)
MPLNTMNVQSDVIRRNLEQMRTVVAEFLQAIPAARWTHPTEKHGWTTHQTLAHLVAAGEGLNDIIAQHRAGQSTHIPGLAQRSDLPTWNERHTDELTVIPPDGLIERLLKVYSQAMDYVPVAHDDRLIPMPMYNRGGTVAEVLGWQCCHVGLVHAAQLANGAGIAPMWERYDPAFMRWMITQFLDQMSHSYRVERGQTLTACINLIVGGQHGGQWHLTIDPAGGSSGEGLTARPNMTLRLPNARAFCNLFTLQYHPAYALLTGKVFVTGNLRLALRLNYLFNPT